MSTTFIELTEEQFDEQYPLIGNHLNPHASWAFADGPGFLFETYGKERAFIRDQNPRRAWTLIDGDDGNLYVISGCHYVNRIGYLLSRDRTPKDTEIQIQIPTVKAEESESL